jgi:hypothetical protein
MMTGKSTSMFSLSSPLAAEPKIRGSLKFESSMIFNISERWIFVASDGFTRPASFYSIAFGAYFSKRRKHPRLSFLLFLTFSKAYGVISIGTQNTSFAVARPEPCFFRSLRNWHGRVWTEYTIQNFSTKPLEPLIINGFWLFVRHFWTFPKSFCTAIVRLLPMITNGS